MRVKDKLISRDEELREKIIQDTIQTQNPSIVNVNIVTDDIQIKQEYVDVGFHHNSTLDSQDLDLDLETETESTIPHTDKVEEEEDLNEFYVDLLRCKDDCETCVKYMRMLSEHVRTTHAPPQPNQDPLLIDPLHIDPDPPHAHQSSSVQIKCEVDDTDTQTIEKMECSEEEEASSESECDSESDPDFDLESVSESESESDPDYSAPYHVTQNVRRQGQGSDKNHSPPTTSKLSKKAKAKIVSSTQGQTVNEEEEGEEVFKCIECAQCFTQLIYLNVHMRVHPGHKPKPFKCDQCEKSFSVKGSLTTHQRIHTGEKPFQCDQCEKRFNSQSGLRGHKRRHHPLTSTTTTKSFQCDVCGKSFFKSHRLVEHKGIHTGEKPFKCEDEECKMRFATSYEHVKHKKTHEKIFKCKSCAKTFKDPDRLIEHTRRRHKLFKCDVCEKSFSIKSSLDGHKRQTSHGRKTVQQKHKKKIT